MLNIHSRVFTKDQFMDHTTKHIIQFSEEFARVRAETRLQLTNHTLLQHHNATRLIKNHPKQYPLDCAVFWNFTDGLKREHGFTIKGNRFQDTTPSCEKGQLCPHAYILADRLRWLPRNLYPEVKRMSQTYTLTDRMTSVLKLINNREYITLRKGKKTFSVSRKEIVKLIPFLSQAKSTFEYLDDITLIPSRKNKVYPGVFKWVKRDNGIKVIAEPRKGPPRLSKSERNRRRIAILKASESQSK